MDKPRLLDLFCGAGGAAMGYARAGFEVVGVDINPQPRYPFEFVQADALTYPLDGFDVVHASPPCQRYSSKTRNRAQHPDLINAVRERLSGCVYVIENVVGAPLHEPVRLCGSSFELPLQRHRLFESSLPLAAPRCRHARMPRVYRVYDHGRWYDSWCVPVYGTGGGKANEYWPVAMGIDWMTRAELVEAIPPAYTEFLGRQLRRLSPAAGVCGALGGVAARAK